MKSCKYSADACAPFGLLDLDCSASLFKLSLELVSLSLRNAFLDSLRSSLNYFLSFLKAETENFLSNLDNCHLSITEGSKDYVELCLSSSAASSSSASRIITMTIPARSSSNSSCYAEFFLDSVNELGKLENRKSLDIFNKFCDLLRSHDNNLLLIIFAVKRR